MPCSLLFLLQWIKNELWADPLQYFIAADADITENGVSDSSDDDEVHHVADDSVVIVGDDTDDDGKLKKWQYSKFVTFCLNSLIQVSSYMCTCERNDYVTIQRVPDLQRKPIYNVKEVFC